MTHEASATGLRFQPPKSATDVGHRRRRRVHQLARLGGWRVDARLAGRACGDDVAEVQAPAALVARLGSEDAVSSLDLREP